MAKYVQTASYVPGGTMNCYCCFSNNHGASRLKEKKNGVLAQ